MNNLIPMQFETNEVRVVDVEGEPWFVAKDVAEALGYADPTTAVRSHCRGVQKQHPIVDSLGRTQSARILAEPDVLRLIVGSKLPAAERFERWVFEDVLPAIRKTGRFGAEPHGRARRPAGHLPVIAAEFRGGVEIAKIAGLSGNQAILSAARATKQVTGVDPLALIGSEHLVSETQQRHYNPTELGKMCGESCIAFNKRLEREGLQVKNIQKHWQPTERGRAYAVILDTGKKHSDGTPVTQLRWYETVLDLLTPPAPQQPETPSTASAAASAIAECKRVLD